jgi:hypothetical protein
MHKWDYMVVEVIRSQGGPYVVLDIDDKRVATKERFIGWKGEPLVIFLKRVGAEGWEAISQGISGTTAEVQLFLLKRPLE